MERSEAKAKPVLWWLSVVMVVMVLLVKGDEMWPVVVKMYDLARKAVALQLSQVERVHVQFIAKLLLR